MQIAQALAEKADKQSAKRSESRLLDKVLKADHNLASVLKTARRNKQRFVRDSSLKINSR